MQKTFSLSCTLPGLALLPLLFLSCTFGAPSRHATVFHTLSPDFTECSQTGFPSALGFIPRYLFCFRMIILCWILPEAFTFPISSTLNDFVSFS